MSCQFIVTYLGEPIRFVEKTAARVRYDVAERRSATVFVAEADAWLAARDYGMDMINTSVESL